MCVIVTSPAGSLPKLPDLEKCFKENSDGAGIMHVHDGKVKIRKGYMTWQAFKTAYTSMGLTEGDLFVLHFRNGTSGTMDETMCHPFPVTANLKVLRARRVDCKLAVAHNGIFGAGEEELSDTAVFVRDVLAPLYEELGEKMLDSAAGPVGKLLRMATGGSSLALLLGSGRLILTGSSWKKEGEVYYSNLHWKYTHWYDRVYKTTKVMTGMGDYDELLRESDATDPSKIDPDLLDDDEWKDWQDDMDKSDIPYDEEPIGKEVWNGLYECPHCGGTFALMEGA